MRFLSLSISILIAILSILIFRETALNFAKEQFDTVLNFLNLQNTNNINSQPIDTTTIVSSSSPSPTFYNPSTSTSSDNNNMSVPRRILKVFHAIEQAEGVGARVRRSIGTPELRNFSPFLMLDHFRIKPGAGFPDHCHRGMETITMLLEGAVDHEDFAGNRGTIEAGDLQFMTAGKGIVHAEMPRQNPDGSANVGLQLWVDLPQHLKMCEPRYRDLKAAEIPAAELDGGKVTVRVISGRSGGVDSVRDLAYTPVWILDVTVRPGGKLTQPLPEGWNAFSYVLEGTATYGDGAGSNPKKVVPQFHNCVFGSEGNVVEVEVPAEAEAPARLFIIAGQVLDQKVVQYGPFVMNTPEEVRQALVDYQFGMNGFERAKGWQSEIGKSMMH